MNGSTPEFSRQPPRRARGGFVLARVHDTPSGFQLCIRYNVAPGKGAAGGSAIA